MIEQVNYSNQNHLSGSLTNTALKGLMESDLSVLHSIFSFFTPKLFALLTRHFQYNHLLTVVVDSNTINLC